LNLEKGSFQNGIDLKYFKNSHLGQVIMKDGSRRLISKMGFAHNSTTTYFLLQF